MTSKTSICDVPAVGLALSGCYQGILVKEKLAILKIVNDFGSLTKADFSGNSLVCLSTDNCSDSTICQASLLAASCELAISDCTESYI